MKIFIFLLMLVSITITPEAHALFGHIAAERDRREHAEQQLAQEQQNNQHIAIEQQRLINRWQTTAFILGISSVVMLVAGTAIGSKGRRDAATK